MVEQLTQHDPRRIGPFEVLGRLGAGGMGLVYLARSASGRRVAIKTVRTELAEDQLFRVRFTREVEAARAVSGFYTAAVVDADPRAAVPWLATAYVPAPSLEEIVNECGPMPTQAVRWLAAGIAEALQSIHGAKLVHRDMKPSNVLVVEDGPRVIDFGIASGVSNTRLTMTNVAVGTAGVHVARAGARLAQRHRRERHLLARLDPRLRRDRPCPVPRGQPGRDGLHAAARGPGRERSARRSAVADRVVHADGRLDAAHPAELQAQLSPHLFASGSDDSGTASAWLPASATEMIEQRRGGGRAVAVAPAPVPPAPVPPAPVAPPAQQPAHVSDGGPVRLSGVHVPIGPGPRAQDVRGSAAAAEAGPATGWVRPPVGANGAVTAATAPVPAPAQAPDSAPAGPGRWRPWRFRMSNDVWGTPVVVGDLLYVTSFEVHALDTGNGRRQFKTRDVAWAMAVDGGSILASDGPSLYALDAATGTERWRLQSDAWVYSLKAERGTVVTGTRGGGVQAWEASTGERLWEIHGAQTDFETAEAGPALHDGTVYLWQDARLRAVDARTGTERWSYPVGDAASCGGVPVRVTPAPDGYVYVSAGTRVLAVDIASGHVRWHFESPAVFLSPPAFAPGPAVTGGGVYLADYLGTVYALDASTGKDRWRIATESRQSIEPVLVVAGNVHVGSGSALYTLDAVTGTPKWRFAAGGEVVGAPVVADGRVHFGSADHVLYTLDAAGGQLRWKLATGGEITGSPVAQGGVVYACSKDRCVYALDALKGTGTGNRPRP